MWTKHYRYKWSPIAVRELKTVLNDEKSVPFREKVLDSFIELKSSNHLATCFTDYITQAADRTFEQNMSKSLTSRRGPSWNDSECHQLRIEAIRAGEIRTLTIII